MLARRLAAQSDGAMGALVFDQVNLVVRDMDASVEFYRRLGVDIADTQPEWRAHHRTAADGTRADFELDSEGSARVWNQGSAGAGSFVLGFRAESRDAVDAVYAELVGAGYRGQQPPYDAFWGSRYAIVEDPDGNGVGIMSAPNRRGRHGRPLARTDRGRGPV
jgi:catechol 2,3-dioxygenase-like lactoylglutathione lyase family enzyme